MANFRKGTWKLGENILDALVVVKLLQTIKHIINFNTPKHFHMIMNAA